MLDAILKQDLRFFDRPENTIGALSSRLESHPQAVLELMGINIAFALVSLFSVLGCAIMSLVVAWKLGVVGVFAGMPPLVLAGLARIRLETRMNTYFSKASSQSASIASESITAIRTVSSLAIENSTLRRYTTELDNAISRCVPMMLHIMFWFSFTQCVEHFVLALGFWCAHSSTLFLSMGETLIPWLSSKTNQPFFFIRWGSKLIYDGEITFYQFMLGFMGVFFSGLAASIMFSFASSKLPKLTDMT